jgi:hypothetical protein
MSLSILAQDSREKEERGQGEVTVTARKLIRDYADNEVAADQKYLGRLVRLVGVARLVAKDLDRRPYVLFGYESGPTLGTHIRCRFLPEIDLAAIKTGSVYGVVGKCRGHRFLNLEMDNCAFVEKNKLDALIRELAVSEGGAPQDKAPGDLPRFQTLAPIANKRTPSSRPSRAVVPQRTLTAEENATSKLKLAKKMLEESTVARGDEVDRLRDRAKARLAEIVKAFPETKAADEARQMLRKLGD